NLVRAVLRRPQTLLLDSALAGFAPYEAEQILASVRNEMKDRTVIVAVSDQKSAEGFDRALTFEGARLAEDRRLTDQRRPAVVEL
ncbi:hypothetical protein ABTA89_19800, partial [Acinetobacter baumannii]